MAAPAPEGIEAEVLAILKRVSRRPIEPTAESELAGDLGFDSLQVLELIAELEDRFDISIPVNDVPAMRTVAHVKDRVSAIVRGTIS